jgi:hypothetical protein
MLPATQPASLRMCARTVAVGGPVLGLLGPEHDATADLGDPAALRRRLDVLGFLWIRGLVPAEAIAAARAHILDHLAAAGALAEGSPRAAGVPRPGVRMPNLMGRPVSRDPAVLGALEHPRVAALMRACCGGPVTTWPFKWLRAVPPGEGTGAHLDMVYMGRGTPDVLTCWMPLGAAGWDAGPLAVMPGSQRSEGFRRLRETYGRMDVDRDRIDGHFTDDPEEITARFGGRWLTTAFAPGDVLVFGMHLLHMSATVAGPGVRISCDARWQLAEAPQDERWIGDQPKGHSAWSSGPNMPMAEARRQWGI